MSNLKHIIETQQDLLAGLERAARGELKVSDLKPICGTFGIIPQRNDLIAARIRITGGELPVSGMQFLAALAAQTRPGYIHFTTRQDIQFHDVTPAAAAKIVRDCTASGLPFRGGNGNSFRNVSTSIYAGVAADSSFDLAPFARCLTDAAFDWDEAFMLPRKFKIAFSAPDDTALALRQDLGFVAAWDAAGNPGFTVYGGGGFGRNAAAGFRLIDFIPPAKIARATRAMIDLFNEHGDRRNRGSARVRYIVARLGKRGFLKLYREYYKSLGKMKFPPVPEFPAAWNLKTSIPLPANAPQIPRDADYKRWRRFACGHTRFKNEYSVMLFVPNGIIGVDEFGRLADLLAGFGIPAVRLSIEQNILIPALPASILPEFHAALKSLPVDLTFASFRNQLNSCIGAAVCKPGILDVPPYASAASAALDEYFRKHPARFTAKRANAIVNGIHFSGCPNSCASHQAARLGFQGTRKKDGDALLDGFTVWRNTGNASIGREDPEFIPAAALPQRIIRMLKESGLL